MKITRLQAENFKKLRAIEIIPGDGAVVPIRGRNAQGKSSVLDAIQAALGGKSVSPKKPIRTGQDESAVRLELDNGALIIRRTFTEDGGGTIIVENADGFRPGSPQKMLDSLYASVAFDPLAFTREKPEEQYRLLRSLVKLDIDPEALERITKAEYDERRDVNRDVKQAETVFENMPVYDGLPNEKVDEAPIAAKIAEASEHNVTIERRKASRERFMEAIENNKALEQREAQTLADLRERIIVHEANLAEVQGIIAAQEKQIAEAEPLPEPIDVAEAQRELDEVRATNAKIDRMTQRQAQELLLESYRTKAANLTSRIESRTTQIREAFEKAEMPVPGLTLAAGTVMFNGEPFDQASSAEQLRVSTAIGMAGNPKLRVMLVRDGSLLDEEGEMLLAEMAAANDFQLWVESVDTSGKVGIIMEDGSVKDAPEPAPIDVGRRKKKPADEPQESASGGEPETVVGPADGQGEGEAVVAKPSPAPEKRVAESLFGDD